MKKFTFRHYCMGTAFKKNIFLLDFLIQHLPSSKLKFFLIDFLFTLPYFFPQSSVGMRNEPLSNEILEVRHEYMAINEKTQGHAD